MNTVQIPATVQILTYNSAQTLERCLQSVVCFAEILVVDGGSTDATIDIAKKYNATIIAQPTTGEAKDFSAIRNFALQKSTQDWIFALDSDEVATPEICTAIRQAVQNQPAAYNVTRKYVLANGAIVEHATTYPNTRLYFFHKDAILQWKKPVHERPQLQPNAAVYNLAGACLAPIGSKEEYQKKNTRYLQIDAEKSKGKGWLHWLQHRVLHTMRSRAIMLVRLLRIWLIPRKGTKMPLQQEFLRFWYGWKLIQSTCPLWNK